MAARNRAGLSEATRKRIRSTMLMNRLQDHVLGKIELTPTQIRAAEILLRKTLPDLVQAEITANVTQEQYVISAQPLETAEKWASRNKKSSGSPRPAHKLN